MNSEDSGPPSPIRQALERNQVAAEVIACDHYRIRGGLAVESDFIISVCPENDNLFEPFSLSKTYSAFRSFAQQLEKVTVAQKKKKSSAPECAKLVKYCELITHLIDSQRTQYLGKVNYLYVKLLAKERKRILNHVLEATLHSFPSKRAVEKDEYMREVALIIQTFFLTDHCVSHAGDDDGNNGGDTRQAKKKPIDFVPNIKLEDLNPLTWLNPAAASSGQQHTPKAGNSSNRGLTKGPSGPIVVPLSRRERRDNSQRNRDEKELTAVAGQEARLLLDDDRAPAEFLPSYSHPQPVVRARSNQLGIFIDNNPLAFLVICAAAVAVLSRAGTLQVRLDGDVALLIVFGAFCLGLHTPRPLVGGFDRPTTMMGAVVKQQQDKSGRQLLSRSMQQQSRAHLTIDDVVDDVLSPAGPVESMSKFPEGAPIGSHDNCWSDPDPEDFKVRGPKYLADKKKVASKKCLFPCRGVNLLLTDTCPVNVGTNDFLLGGRLRDKPTFIINFRLPWGILLFYFEIPERFVPFVRAAYEDGVELPGLDDMTPAERCVSRFLMKDAAHKNGTFKIIPVVIDGPWVVRSVVGGKPAIVGNKLPTEWHYSAAEKDKALYIEVDLDIAASSAARGILSVTRSYTQILTLNLGFVVQGNEEDELPEQMLVGTRLHGIDPLTSPAYPEQGATENTAAAGAIVDEEDSESVTPVVKLA